MSVKKVVTQLRLVRLFSGQEIGELAQTVGIARTTLGLVETQYQRCPEKWKEPIAAALHVEANSLFNDRGMARIVTRECLAI